MWSFIVLCISISSHYQCLGAKVFHIPPSTLAGWWCLYKCIEGIATHADTDQTWLRFRFQTYKQPLIPKQQWLTVMRWDDDVPKEQPLQKKLLGADCQEQYLQKLFLLGEVVFLNVFSGMIETYISKLWGWVWKMCNASSLHTFYILFYE